MGHNHLGTLPRTIKWQQVVELIDDYADLPEIADASLKAALSGLKRAASDPGFITTLTQIFLFLDAAAGKDLIKALTSSGYDLSAKASLFEIISSFKLKVDLELWLAKVNSDVGEIAQNAFTESLLRYALPESQSLFGPDPQMIHRSISALASSAKLRVLMHEFFSNFVRRYLAYFLSRETSNHVGLNKRFENISEHNEFTEAFNLYIRQTVRIADEFTPGWFGKARYEKRLSEDSVVKYAHIAFKKIQGEFARGGGDYRA